MDKIVGARAVTGIFVLLKNCPRTKTFKKILSYRIKYFSLGLNIFVLGQKISENFCPKICPTPHRTKNFRKVSENFCPRIKIFRHI